MRGQGRLYKRGTVWWADYTVGGERRRESTSLERRRDAAEWLRQRIGDRRAGRLIGSPDKVTLAEIRTLVERRYTLDGRRSVERVRQAYAHLEEFFGREARLSEITPRRDAYAAWRLAAGRAPATVGNELAQLRRGYHLARETGQIAVVPPFTLPKAHNARSGFFEEGELAALVLELRPPAARDLIEFLRLTGWRRDEGRLLQWARVDLDGDVMRLEGARSKSGRPRTFPFGRAPRLQALLAARRAEREGLYVFHRDGEPLGKQALRYAWEHACLRAGLATQDADTKKITAHRLVHDLRRTAARDFRRAGVSEGEIMALCGWETRSMFDRYNIIDEQDLARAVARRYGTAAAQSAPAPASGDALSSTAAT